MSFFKSKTDKVSVWIGIISSHMPSVVCSFASGAVQKLPRGEALGQDLAGQYPPARHAGNPKYF